MRTSSPQGWLRLATPSAGMKEKMDGKVNRLPRSAIPNGEQEASIEARVMEQREDDKFVL